MCRGSPQAQAHHADGIIGRAVNGVLIRSVKLKGVLTGGVSEGFFKSSNYVIRGGLHEKPG